MEELRLRWAKPGRHAPSTESDPVSPVIQPVKLLKKVFRDVLTSGESVQEQKPEKQLLLSIPQRQRRHSQQLPAPNLSLTKSTFDLRFRRIHTQVPPTASANRLQKMMQDCSKVQQSLMPMWKQACHQVSGSLQELETSRQALTSSTASRYLWKNNRRYLQTRNNLCKPQETGLEPIESFQVSPKSKVSLRIIKHVKRSSEPITLKPTEDQELLDEIRTYHNQEYDYGDLFKPVTSPSVKLEPLSEEIDSDTLKSLSELNQFIFKERSRYSCRGLASSNQRRKIMMETLMSEIEPSPEVYQKAQKIIMRGEKKKTLKATRVDNFKQTSFSGMLKTWLQSPISEENKELMAEIQAGELDLSKKTAIENYRKALRRKQLQDGRPLLSTLAA